MRSYLQTTFGLELEEAQLSYKGWNWGQATVEAGTVNFAVESKLALELPLNDVSQATAQKNEAVIEMQDDDTANPEDEIITEMRFFLPPNAPRTPPTSKALPPRDSSSFSSRAETWRWRARRCSLSTTCRCRCRAAGTTSSCATSS